MARGNETDLDLVQYDLLTKKLATGFAEISSER